MEKLTFLEEEKLLYLEMFPDSGLMFGDDDDNTSIIFNDEHNNDESKDKGTDALVYNTIFIKITLYLI